MWVMFARQTAAEVAQCALACVYGCAFWLLYPHTENPMERLYGALIAGIGGVWLTMFLWTALRYGWRTARSMKMH